MLKLKLIESKGQHNGQVSINLCIAVADISKHTFIRVCDIYTEITETYYFFQVTPASEDRARRPENRPCSPTSPCIKVDRI